MTITDDEVRRGIADGLRRLRGESSIIEWWRRAWAAAIAMRVAYADAGGPVLFAGRDSEHARDHYERAWRRT